MTKLFYAAAVLFILTGCNNSTDSKNATGDTTKTTDGKMMAGKDANLDLPYQLDHAYQEWQPGNEQYAVTVMKGLKGFEMNDMAACMASFGDSVFLDFDYMQAKMSNDSAKKFFTEQRNSIGNISVKMGDWESVKSADGKEEWVTLWYRQYVTDKKGMVDSAAVINDAKMVNGKIVELHESSHHLGPQPAKK
ncbi:MAG: hypothetical protein JST86_04685 [Bacteroidetes bacterium]|nr:hypothetical protein [Bacteroidota bacterium]